MGLELVVSLLIAAVGVSSMFLWLSYTESHHLSGIAVRSVNGKTTTLIIASSAEVEVWVSALDEHGSGLPGVSVTLTGSGTGAVGTTGTNGSVLLSFQPVPALHSPYASMSVSGSYTPPATIGEATPQTSSTSFVVYFP